MGYQGRTYQATLSNGQRVALTVAAGRGEIKRLQALALSRHGYEIVGLLDPIRGRHRYAEPRWWNVEVRGESFGDRETDLLTVKADCPALIPFAVGEHWEVAAWKQGEESAARVDFEVF